MNKKTIAAAIVVIALIVSFITVGYPFFFRGSLADPSVEMDSKEGKAWLDTQIVMEFRGSHSKEVLLETLEISPKVKIGEDNLKVEHIARFPWHEDFPWAKTRVTINLDKDEIFAPETSYTVSIRDKELKFETITLPEVLEAAALVCRPFAITAWWNDGTSTTACFELDFNEKIVWEDRYFSVSPPAEVQLSASEYNGKTSVLVSPTERWENSTEYTLTIKKGLKDNFGHELVEDYSLSFTTRPPSKVIEATPKGESAPIDSVIRGKFDRLGVRNSHDLKFDIQPKVEGTLEWEEDGLTFVWKPKKGLSYSTEYEVLVGGKSWEGDPIPEYRWSFKTEDPPVSVEIQETTHSPRVLRAVASGGLGKYSYEWSTGETSDSISVEVPAGETWNISVTVASGDQTASAGVNVSGPPLPPPPPAPEPPTSAPAPSPPTPGGGMKFVLSFDDSDGSGAIVSGILDTLARYGAKAIFFPTGSWAVGNPIINRMLAEGHMVCNHTRDHADLTSLSEAGIREQILGGAGVGTCNLLRPPYGAHNAFVDSVAASMGYSIYMWTVDPRDWSGTSVSYITSTILNNASPGGIVVLHMHAGNTLLALPAIIEGLQAAGYTLSY